MTTRRTRWTPPPALTPKDVAMWRAIRDMTAMRDIADDETRTR